MLWILILVSLFIIIYRKLKSYRNYWIERGVQQNKNGFILGDNWKTVIRKQSLPEMVQMAYTMCPLTRYSGFYQFLSPILIIKDPDLIKQIAVKDFDFFVNHQSIIPDGVDPLFSNNLTALKDEKWREMRATLSPVFTSSKMRLMFSLIIQNSQQFVQHFLQKNEEIITVEMKDIFTRFTNDVIANVAFGIEIESLKDPDNEFYAKGKELTDFGGFVKMMKFFGAMLVPKLFQIFKISLFTPSIVKFFSHTVKSNIETRRKQRIVRSDMINILMETALQDSKSSSTKESENPKVSQRSQKITDDVIVSQAIAFFFAGFDTVSSLMCFMSYELGLNPQIQEKLRREVDRTLKSCNGKITYEAIQEMKYMDMVVSESLRKWPNVAATDRVCTKSYTIEVKYVDESPLLVEKGTILWLPIFALHRDPKYHPDPERFDPERFSDEKKDKIRPYSYIPFGVGPRACIGARLGLLETKTLFFHLLVNFEIVPVETTPIPLRISKRTLNMTAEGGFWLGLKRRLK